MSACLKTKKYGMAELVESREGLSGHRVMGMHFETNRMGGEYLMWEENGRREWGNLDVNAVWLARTLTGLNVKSAKFNKYDFDKVLEIVYEEDKVDKPSTEAVMMEPAAFEDELMKLWNAQYELTTRIGGLLDVCGFSSEEYVDWLNDYCLGEDGQIERLLDLYKEKYDKESEKCQQLHGCCCI